MDLNLVVLAGRIAAEPELKTFESGSSLLRLLVTVRSEEPKRRVDVVPVVWWDPDLDGTLFDGPVRGRRVWIVGSIQRRFWSAEMGRLSSVEIVAQSVQLQAEEKIDE